jgi:hypothetical protein
MIAQSRRRRDLVAIFLDALGGRAAVSELQLVQVRKAAELTTAAEAVRARVLAGDAGWTLSCSSRSRGARRAVRALNLKTAAKRRPTFAHNRYTGRGRRPRQSRQNLNRALSGKETRERRRPR